MSYRKNHYVPVWYQERFFPDQFSGDRKFTFLDLKPETIVQNGRRYSRKARLHWGPKRCFWENDLYTTSLGGQISTEIEQLFFGPVDDSAKPSLDYFHSFTHPSATGEHLHTLLLYMSIQKLRTPKGLRYLGHLLGEKERHRLLFALQRLQALFCAHWTESIWSIADASTCSTKFLLSDHPVTSYNMGCFPASSYCRDGNDPHVWMTGTHTLFPLSYEKILILTNLSWVRNPYARPTKLRPNPKPLRAAMFDFRTIQTGRSLFEEEVAKINFIIKQRAYRYVAACEEEWLYPERVVNHAQWDSFGKDYLLMPDPRALVYSDQVRIGFKDGSSDAYNAYGMKPWEKGFEDSARTSKELETFYAFKGEFARKFGPRRRGQSFELCSLSQLEDDPDSHKYHLGLEQRHKKYRYKR